MENNQSSLKEHGSGEFKNGNGTRIPIIQKSLTPHYNFYWLMLSLFVCSMMFVYTPMPSMPRYNEGEIAQSTVKAPVDLQFTDEDATELRKEDARQNVAPVYDYDPMLRSMMISRLDTIFEEGRKYLQWKKSIKPETEPNHQKNAPENEDSAMYVQTIKNSLTVELPKEAAQALIESAFPEQLQKALQEIIENCSKNKIISDKRIIQYNAKHEFVLKDIASSKEYRYKNVNDIVSLEDMYTLIATLLPQKQGVGAENVASYAGLLKLLLIPNVNFNSQETLDRRLLAVDSTEPVVVQIKKGKVIIRDGEEVSDKQIRQLAAIQKYKNPQQQSKNTFNIATVIMFALLFIYVVSKNHPVHNILLRNKNVLLLLVFVFAFSLLWVRLIQVLSESVSNSFISSPYNNPTEYFYLLPFAFGALAVTILVDSQIALAFSLIFSLTSVLLLNADIPRFIYILASCVAATFCIKRYRQRSDLIKAGALIGFANIAGVLYLTFLNSEEIIYDTKLFHLIIAFAGGIISAILASVIIPLIESVFQLLTEFKLMELGNIDSPLVKELAIKAPGTYHHSMVASILAERASLAIRVNSLFVRVVALYHDVGKIAHPEVFIENQRGNNVHDMLKPLESARAIISHVHDGYVLAKKYKLPKDLIEVISQHHGRKLVNYFYSKACKETPEPPPDQADFRYPGPKPQSKESAIIMLADSVEAASRTIEHADVPSIKNLVDKIIQNCFEDKQLDESNLTIRELNVIAESMVNALLDMKHGRVAYPGFDFSQPSKQTFSYNDHHDSNGKSKNEIVH